MLLPPPFGLPEASIRIRGLSLPVQKVILLPPAAVPELQVPDARAAQRDEGARCPEEGATSGLLQHPEGGPLARGLCDLTHFSPFPPASKMEIPFIPTALAMGPSFKKN